MNKNKPPEKPTPPKSHLSNKSIKDVCASAVYAQGWDILHACPKTLHILKNSPNIHHGIIQNSWSCVFSQSLPALFSLIVWETQEGKAMNKYSEDANFFQWMVLIKKQRGKGLS